jgi:hypothetical protein
MVTHLNLTGNSDIMASLTPSAGTEFIPYHGNNCPWLPILHQTDRGLHGFRGLVVDYIIAVIQQ